MISPTRRQFLKLTAGLGLGATAAAVLEKFALSTAWAQTQTDYKALVCVFLNGGNDSNNMIVPLSGGTGFGSADVTGGWPAYFNERNLGGAGLVSTAAGTALPPATGPEPTGSLHRISAGAANPNLGPFGMNWFLGLNYSSVNGTVTISVPSLKARYDLGKMAVVSDVGTLFQSINKTQYQQGVGRPQQLFSHSDQISQNQTCIFTPAQVAPGGTGWGGRTADRTISLNGTATFPMQTSISGGPQFMTGVSNFPLVISPHPTTLNNVLVLNGFGTAADEVARRTAFNNLRTVDKTKHKLVDAASKVMDDALAVSAALSVEPTLYVRNPNDGTPLAFVGWPNTTLGNQLRQVAKVIKANLQQPALALRRQIFFCSVGGWDTHQNQTGSQTSLLQQINQAIATFYYWLENNVPGTGEPTLGDLTPKVTTFTLSDFSRTFNPAGSGAIVGSDHAWASQFLVLGGAVQGGRFYGLPLPGGNGTIYHTLSKGTASAYDVGTRGLWLPSVSTMQYANTLAAWYGLPQDSGTVDYVFPLLRANFATTNLGFI